MKLLLGLGSNLGNLHENLREARQRIGELCCIVRASSEIETAPWGYESSNMYLNQVLVCECDMEPLELLRSLQGIERSMGRTAKTTNGHYEDRIIDIDILTYGDIHISTPELTIPHSRMLQRQFILDSLVELQEI